MVHWYPRSWGVLSFPSRKRTPNLPAPAKTSRSPSITPILDNNRNCVFGSCAFYPFVGLASIHLAHGAKIFYRFFGLFHFTWRTRRTAKTITKAAFKIIPTIPLHPLSHPRPGRGRFVVAPPPPPVVNCGGRRDFLGFFRNSFKSERASCLERQ